MSTVFVSPDEIAADAGITRRTVDRDLSGGRLRSLLIEGRRLIAQRDADLYIAKRHALADAYTALGGGAAGK